MRRMRQGLGMLLTIGLGILGCADRNIALRPPKHPEDIVEPPVADARFASPIKYPELANGNADSDRASAGGGTPNVGAMNMGGGGMGMPMGGMMGMNNMLGGYGR
jgi:hypothetical protein